MANGNGASGTMTAHLCTTLRPGLLPAAVVILTAGLAASAMAQMGPRTRTHTALQSEGADLYAATRAAPGTSRIEIRVEGGTRIISANGLPSHGVGEFPNRDNPNTIRAQSYTFHLDATPKLAGHTRPVRGFPFGIAVNGVVFNPVAAEWYMGRRGEWQYEAMSGAIALGLDANNAHVQPSGTYHYHGLPTGLLNELGVSRDAHSPIIGWAADGFPIYARYGQLDRNDPASPIVEHTSSYRLKEGKRPGGDMPGGFYDGTFTADYAYVAGSGTLDECNGTFAVTPDFPDGTYAYFLTADWPVIPRCLRGTPAQDFIDMIGDGQRGAAGGQRPLRDGGRFGGPPPSRF